jgi:hypothetical protein
MVENGGITANGTLFFRNQASSGAAVKLDDLTGATFIGVNCSDNVASGNGGCLDSDLPGIKRKEIVYYYYCFSQMCFFSCISTQMHHFRSSLPFSIVIMQPMAVQSIFETLKEQ